LAATHLSARFAFRLAVVVDLEYQAIQGVVVVVGVSCLLAEPGLLLVAVQQVVERQGFFHLMVATPYLVAVQVAGPLQQVANLFTVVAAVVLALAGLVLAGLVEPAFMAVVVAMVVQALAALVRRGLFPVVVAEAVLKPKVTAETELLAESSSLFGKE